MVKSEIHRTYKDGSFKKIVLGEWIFYFEVGKKGNEYWILRLWKKEETDKEERPTTYIEIWCWLIDYHNPIIQAPSIKRFGNS